MQGYDNGNFGPTDKVQRDQAAAIAVRTYNYLLEQQPELYEVTAVEAISTKAIRVTFNRAVEDTSAVKFDVKRNGQAVELAAKWAEDKTSVVLESESKLQPGTYTVTVTGLDFAEGKNTGSVTIEAEKVAKIEIVGDKLIRDREVKSVARVTYRVLNQYGEDITTSALATGVKATATQGKPEVEQAGVVKVTNDGGQEWQLDTKVTVALVHEASGVTGSKTLTVADAAQLSSFEFGDIIYANDAKRIYIGQENAAWIEVKATDANGQAVSAQVLDSAIELFGQNKLEGTVTTKDGKTVIALDTSSVPAPGQYRLTAVVLAAPELSKSITVDVVAQPYPAALALAEDAVTNLLVGATANVKVLLKDQYGGTFAEWPEDYSIQASSNDTGVVVASERGDPAREVELKAKNKGTATVTVTLRKSGAVVDAVQPLTFTVTVEEATGDLQYSLGTIPELYWDGDGDGARASRIRGSCRPTPSPSR